MKFLLYITLCCIIVCTDSYVLLSANIDDFKDLVRKIVPGRFADELTNTFLHKIINASLQNEVKNATSTINLERPTIYNARRSDYENAYKPVNKSVIEHNSRKKQPFYEFRSNDKYDATDIEKIAEKVSELLVKKYHINLETTSNQKQRKKTDSFAQEAQNEDRFERNRDSTTVTYQRPSAKPVTSPLYEGSIQNVYKQPDYSVEPVYRSNRPNTESDSAELITDTPSYNKNLYQKPYSMNLKQRVTKTKLTTTNRNFEPPVEPRENLYSKELNPSKPNHQTIRSQHAPIKKTYKKPYFESEYHKNNYEPPDTTRIIKTSKANSQEYYVEYEYYADDKNNRQQTTRTLESTKKVNGELLHGQVDSTNTYKKPLDNVPNKNFYLKVPPEEKNNGRIMKVPDVEPTETLILGFLSQKTPAATTQNKPTNDPFKVIDLNTVKRNIYEDYQEPQKSKNMFSNNENLTPNKNNVNLPKNKAVQYEDDYEGGRIANEDIQAATMTIGQWYDGEALIRSTTKKSFIVTKYSMDTMVNYRSKFTISTPNYLFKLPQESEKYDFREPLPENDRDVEKIEFIGNPEESINNKVRLQRY